MAVLPVVTWPNKVLDTKAEPVTVFDENLKKLAADMFETMESHHGCGLAANQVGVLQRIFVVYIAHHECHHDHGDGGHGHHHEEKQWFHNKELVFVNPKIVKTEGREKSNEGCLSFPKVYETIERADKIVVQAQDLEGKQFEMEATDLLSVCIQHELDHLDGIVFTKRMSRLKAMMAVKKIQKQAVAAARA